MLARRPIAAQPPIAGLGAAVAFTCAVAMAAMPLAASAQNVVPEGALVQLTGVQGTVLVDRGTGFVQISQAGPLRFGDRVLVSDGGAAVLDYGGECTLPLAAPSMITVTETACSVGTQGEETAASASGSGAGMVVLLGAAAAAGLGAWCLVHLCKEDTASP